MTITAVSRAGELEKIEQWGVYELSRQETSTGNPYQDVTFKAKFKHDSHTLTVPGFYDGNGGATD